MVREASRYEMGSEIERQLGPVREGRPVRFSEDTPAKQQQARDAVAAWRQCNGVVFTGASSVAVTRYRYRGSTIPTPWTPAPAPG
ncbi:MAG: hypothetical protein ACRDPY_21625 [Streptosporangiaceae bacterium]